MQPCVLPGDGESEAAALGAGARGVRLVEAVEDVRQHLVGDAGAVVGDVDHQGLRCGGRPDGDGSGAVAQGVADQVGEDDVDAPRVDPDARILLRKLGDHLVRLAPAAQLKRLVDDGAEAHVVQAQLGGARVEAGDLHQVLDHGGQLAGLVADEQDRVGGVRGQRLRTGVLVQGVRDGGHRGERGPQLVRDVGGEPAGVGLHPPQLGGVLLQRGGHGVERARQGGEFVLARDVEAGTEGARGDLLGGRTQLSYGTQHAAGREQGGHDGEGERGDGAGPGRGDQGGDVGPFALQGHGGVGDEARRLRRRRAAAGLSPTAASSVAGSSAPARSSVPGGVVDRHADQESRSFGVLHALVEGGVAAPGRVAQGAADVGRGADERSAVAGDGRVPGARARGAVELAREGAQVRVGGVGRQIGGERVDLEAQIVDGAVLGAVQDRAAGLPEGERGGDQRAERGDEDEGHDQAGAQAAGQGGLHAGSGPKR
ncbi:hypothetical protein SMD44_07728 [Streptomyces alboflavus]|uniref:Uncharacterized protein n=1 Tax=Streptomyces alboflavus TaxID=67267 RepID=A0A1Z1WP56_9ACTN|nr:hypothetical protein SMD44_07728 [Streptomyces alboflavus]